MEKKLYYRYENQSNGDNNFTLVEKKLNGRWKNCFDTKEEATEHFEEALRLAEEKHTKIVEGLDKLREELGDFSFEYYMEGDTFGIYEEGNYIGFELNGYDFEF